MCGKLTAVLTWFIVLGLLTSEFILMLRTYAIWDRSRKAFYVLLATGILLSALGIISTELELQSIKFMPSRASRTRFHCRLADKLRTVGNPTYHQGCHISEAGSIIFLAYVSLLICETMIAVMTAIRAFSHLRRSHSDFVVTLYRDGFFFYLCCIGISLLNVILTVAGPRLVNWLVTLQHIVHSICCSRVLFFIFKSQRRAEIWNLEPSEPSVPTSSDYFTSILPPPSVVHSEGIQMKSMVQVGRGAGVEVVHLGRGDGQPEELFTNGLDSVTEHIPV